MTRVFIQTFGCQLNVAESDCLAGILKRRGAEITDDEKKADFIIVNTCAVRKSAESRASGQLGHYKKTKEDNGSSVILTGCMAEKSEEELRKSFPFVDFFVRNNDKMKIADIVSSGLKKYSCRQKYVFEDSYLKENSFESYVPIQNGCNNFCTYCIVPYTRGREISRDFNAVLSELDFIDSRGVKVVTLLGQNVNSYKFEGKTFEELVKAADEKNFSNIKRIYFDSPHPKDFSDSLIKILSASRYFPHHYHIPVQSGSDRVLKDMNRRGTADEIFRLFDKIRNVVPDASFSTDIMVGFPTEGDDDFELTLDMVRKLRFTDAFMYYYNERPGTFACKNYKDMEVKIKTERLEELIKVQREISTDIRKKKIGSTTEVFVKTPSKSDGYMLSYTASNEAVLVPSSFANAGDFIKVRLTSLSGETFIAGLAK